MSSLPTQVELRVGSDAPAVIETAGRPPRAHWAPFAITVGATLLALWFHWVFLQHGGALWRDEVGFVNIANLPAWRDLWQMQALDHCPVLPFALLRGWCAAFGSGDHSLRVYGAVVGVSLVAVLWVAARCLRGGPPALALALLAANVEMIRFSATLRGYGLGCVLNVLTFAVIWRVVQRPSWGRALAAAVVAVASVQALYQNAFFVLGAGIGGMLVGARRRDLRTVLVVVGVGLVAALSLVPYVPVVRQAQDAYVLVKVGFEPSVGWRMFTYLAGAPWPGMAWVWCGLAAATAGAAGVTLWRGCCRENGAVIYAGTTLILGVAGFAVFLHVAGFRTYHWYYLPPLVLTAVCVDAALPGWHRWARWTLLAGATGVLLVAAFSGPGNLRRPHTTIDTVATRLAREVSPGDFVLVTPWYAGITFQRYYRGPASWDTIPALADHHLHRYDLFKVEMQKENPLEPLVDRLATTLKAGHRVWVVGDFEIQSEPPQPLPPAPHAPTGWIDYPYWFSWSDQIGYFLRRNAREGVVLSAGTDGVALYEESPVLVFSGWRRSRTIFDSWPSR